MQTQDTSRLKDKIISRIRMKGPSLPVHIAKEIETDTLFASAFLSELISEKRLKLSNVKVGNSPLYFIPGQEHLLENFGQHLKSKEKEAFELLKGKKMLRDSDQPPAIRVALREIKDFAIPFKKDDEFYWRYLTISDQELVEKIRDENPLIREVKKQFEEKEKEVEVKKEPVLKKPKEEPLEIKEEVKRVVKKIVKAIELTPSKKPIKKTVQKEEGTFFNRVKEYLLEKSMAITDIEGVSKNTLVLKVKTSQGEKLIVAYDKKRISEADIVKAHRKAAEAGLKYTILSFGGPLKKLKDFIEAIKDLEGIRKIE